MSRSRSTPGRDLDEFHAVRRPPEHAALGHIEDSLSDFGRVGAAEGDLLDLVDEFRGLAFPDDAQLAVRYRDIEASGREGAGKDKSLGALRDIDEAAGAGDAAAEAADVDVAFAVGLRHAEARKIEPAAVIEIELLVLLDDGFGVQGGAEIEPALRHAADDAGLGRQREIFQNPLFRGHGRDALGHADAEIDDAARRQLESAAPGNHLALVEVQRLDAVERHALAAGIRVVIGGGVGLEVVSGPGDDHAIDQNTGDLHLARVERTRRRRCARPAR